MHECEWWRQAAIYDGFCLEREVQWKVTDDGLQKGMKTMFEKRGIDMKRMNADKIREML